MIDQSLLQSNFLGRDGFRWWIGQIPPIKSQGKQANGGGWGNRCKVRILGYHPYSEKDLPNDDLPWAQVLLPATSGSGGANYAQNTKLTPGDIVFGFFLDGDNAQIPVIMGCFGRTSQVPSDDFSNPFAPFTGYTDNIKKPNGTLKADQSNEQNTKSQKSPRDIPPSQVQKLNSNSKDKDEIPYYSGVGKKIVFGNSCNDTTIKGISTEVNNLLDKIQNSTNVFLNIGNEIKRSVDKVLGLANNLVGQMFNSLFNKLVPLLQEGLKKLYEAVFSKVLALTGSTVAAHLAGVAAQTAMIPPVKFLEENITTIPPKIINTLFSSISDLLQSTVKNVQNFNSCAGTQFSGALANHIIDKIVNGLSDALDGVKKILTPAFQVASFLRSGVSAIRSLGGLFDKFQSQQKCSGLVKEWTIGAGGKDSGDENKKFNDILKGMNVAASIGKVFKDEDITKNDSIVEDNFAGIVRNFVEIRPTDTKIVMNDISKIKVGSLIAPQFNSVNEFMQVQAINKNTKEVTVLRNYIGTAVTYSGSSSFSVIDPIEKKETKKKVPPSTFEGKYGSWDIFSDITKKSNQKTPLGGCYTGPPTSCNGVKVAIFGGGGDGCTATAILGSFANNPVNNGNISNSVKKTASIIGVRVDNKGSGYRYPPFVEFIDECNLGYGAVARSIINDSGQVIAIYIVSEGENYPVGGDVEPQIVDDVIIDDPGEDYDPGDIIVDDLGGTYAPVVDNGKIISVKPININVITDLPVITVKSKTGTGAVLRPILKKYSPPQGEVKQVIDCIT